MNGVGRVGAQECDRGREVVKDALDAVRDDNLTIDIGRECLALVERFKGLDATCRDLDQSMGDLANFFPDFPFESTYLTLKLRIEGAKAAVNGLSVHLARRPLMDASEACDRARHLVVAAKAMGVFREMNQFLASVSAFLDGKKTALASWKTFGELSRKVHRVSGALLVLAVIAAGGALLAASYQSDAPALASVLFSAAAGATVVACGSKVGLEIGAWTARRSGRLLTAGIAKDDARLRQRREKWSAENAQSVTDAVARVYHEARGLDESQLARALFDMAVETRETSWQTSAIAACYGLSQSVMAESKLLSLVLAFALEEGISSDTGLQRVEVAGLLLNVLVRHGGDPEAGRRRVGALAAAAMQKLEELREESRVRAAARGPVDDPAVALRVLANDAAFSTAWKILRHMVVQVDLHFGNGAIAQGEEESVSLR